MNREKKPKTPKGVVAQLNKTRRSETAKRRAKKHYGLEEKFRVLWLAQNL